LSKQIFFILNLILNKSISVLLSLMRIVLLLRSSRPWETIANQKIDLINLHSPWMCTFVFLLENWFRQIKKTKIMKVVAYMYIIDENWKDHNVVTPFIFFLPNMIVKPYSATSSGQIVKNGKLFIYKIRWLFSYAFKRRNNFENWSRIEKVIEHYYPMGF